jgi:UrcA family protein
MMKTMVSVALAAAALAATPATAQIQEIPVSKRVFFGDLALESADGRATLDRRIRHAVREVCGPVSDGNLKTFLAAQRCRRDAVSSAGAQVNQVLASRGVGAGIAIAAR